MHIKLTSALITFILFFSLTYEKTTYAEAEQSQPLSQSIGRILILGDSLSAAYKLPKSQGWVALLQQHLQSQSINIHVENASVSGSTTAAALQRLDLLLKTHKPTLVILELGANDGLQGKPLTYIQKNLEQLIQNILSSNAKILLLGVHLPPNLGKRYTEPFFNQYKTLADKYQLGLAPFMLEGVATHPELMLSDGLHPNAEGQKKVFTHLWPSLEKAIKSSNQQVHN